MPARTTCSAIFLVTLLLTGCQTVNNSIDAIGGLFLGKQTKNCSGENCENESLIDNTATNQNWYCYGSIRGADWDCQRTPDQTKIKPVTDAPTNRFAEPVTLNSAEPQAQSASPQRLR